MFKWRWRDQKVIVFHDLFAAAEVTTSVCLQLRKSWRFKSWFPCKQRTFELRNSALRNYCQFLVWKIQLKNLNSFEFLVQFSKTYFFKFLRTQRARPSQGAMATIFKSAETVHLTSLHYTFVCFYSVFCPTWNITFSRALFDR